MKKISSLFFFFFFFILFTGCTDNSDENFTTTTEIEEAEQLSLEATKELTAPYSVYKRVLADLIGIRASYSKVAGISSTPTWNMQSLIVNFDDETMAEIRSGEYNDWNDLNNNFEGTIDTIYSTVSAVVLKFEGRYYIPLLKEEYNALRGVTGVDEDTLIFIPEEPPDDICLTIEQDTYYYIFTRKGALEAAFQTDPEGNIIEINLNEIDVNQNPPSWFTSCQEWLM